MNLQEIVFQVIWDAIGKDIDPARLAAALSTSPRKVFGISTANISEGNNAELTIFTTTTPFTLQADNIKSASRNNPFIGKELMGNIVGIINNGKIHLNK